MNIPTWAGGSLPPKPASVSKGRIPTGRYAAVIIDTGEVTNGAFFFFTVTLMVIDGPYTGLKIVDELHCKDPDIAVSDEEYGRLSEICYACRIPENSPHPQASQLHGIPILIDVVTVGKTTLVQHYHCK